MSTSEERREIIDQFRWVNKDDKNRANVFREYSKSHGITRELVRYMYIQRFESHGGENRTKAVSVKRCQKTTYGVGVLTYGGHYFCFKVSRWVSVQKIGRNTLETFRAAFLKKFWFNEKSSICIVDKDNVVSVLPGLMQIVAGSTFAKIFYKNEPGVLGRLREFLPARMKKKPCLKNSRHELFRRLTSNGALEFAGDDFYATVMNLTQHDQEVMRSCAIGVFYMFYSEHRSNMTRATPKYKGLKSGPKRGRLLSGDPEEEKT